MVTAVQGAAGAPDGRLQPRKRSSVHCAARHVRLAAKIDEIGAAITEREILSADLEAMFANPERFDDRAHMESSAERYRVLKEEEQSLWEEWERLSLEGEEVDRKLTELKGN